MILTRINPMGLEYQLVSRGEETKICLIKSPSKSITVKVPIADMSQMWYNWQMLRQNIQVAFGVLNAEQREFLMTGITPAEWKEIFKDGEEE